jgi:hypothetical protein
MNLCRILFAKCQTALRDVQLAACSHAQDARFRPVFRLPTAGTLRRYSKALEYKYIVKIAALGTLKRYSIISLTLYLEWYSAYSIMGNGGPH